MGLQLTKSKLDAWEKEIPSSKINRDKLNEWENEKSNSHSSLKDIPRNILGGAVHGFQSVIDNPLNLLGNVLNNKTLKNIKPNELPGVDTNSLSYRIPSFLQEAGASAIIPELGFISKLASPALKALPKIGNFANKALASNKALDYGLMGALQNPTSPLIGGGINALVGGGLNSIAVNPLNQARKNLFDKDIEEKATTHADADAALRMLHPESDIDNQTVQKEISNRLRSSYSKVKKNANNLYENLFDTFENGSDELPLKTENLSNKIKNLDYDLSDILPRKQAINLEELGNSKRETNIRELQNLQSDIRRKASDLKSSSNGSERQKGHALSQLGESIVNDMQDAFEKVGLKEPFQQARSYYRQSVIPFTDNPNIWKLVSVSDKEKPSLTRDEINSAFKNPEGDADKSLIANSLGNQFKNMILHNHLSDVRNIKGSVKAEDLISKYADLPNSGLHAYLTPEAKGTFDRLLDRLEKKNPGKYITPKEYIPPGVKDILKNIFKSEFVPSLGTATGAIAGHTINPLLGAYVGREVAKSSAWPELNQALTRNGLWHNATKGLRSGGIGIGNSILQNLLSGENS